MKSQYKVVAIHIKTQSEKLGALYHLAALAETTISPNVLSETLENEGVTTYPYVFIDSGGEVTATSNTVTRHDIQTVVEFKDMATIEAVVKNLKVKTVKLNNDYIAEVSKDGKVKVGCQTFRINILRKVIKAYDDLNK